MVTISATHARQKWAQTLDQANKLPVTITEHGRETLVLMEAEWAEELRAERALDNDPIVDPWTERGCSLTSKDSAAA